MATTAGIIGCGNISDTYLRMAPRFPALAIVACADRVADAATAKAAAYAITAVSVDELLADPAIDLVINLTVPNAHAEVTLAALAAGKHVYSEKPLATSVADGHRILAAVVAAGRRVGCAPDTLLGGGHQRARQVVDSGAIGRPLAATATYLTPGIESWHPNPAFFYQPGGGPVLDVGPYYIAALVNLMGPVRRVVARAATSFAERTVTSAPLRGTKIPVAVPTLVVGTLEFASGALATIMMSWDVKAHGHNHIEVYGAEGSLIVPSPIFFGGDCRVSGGGGDPAWRDVPPGDLPFAELNWPPEAPRLANHRIVGVVDMAEALQSGRPHRLGAEFALHTLEVMQAVQAATGESVAIASTCARPPPMAPGAAGFGYA